MRPTPAQLRKRLEDIAKGHAPPVTNIAKVKSVDEANAVCILEDEDGQEILDVRLRPVLSGKASFIMLPKVGTQAMAVRIEDDDDWMIIACDEITKVMWKTETTTVELSDKVKIESNGESLATLMDDFFTAVLAMSFVTPSGNTTALVNADTFTELKTRFNNLLK